MDNIGIFNELKKREEIYDMKEESQINEISNKEIER